LTPKAAVRVDRRNAERAGPPGRSRERDASKSSCDGVRAECRVGGDAAVTGRPHSWVLRDPTALLTPTTSSLSAARSPRRERSVSGRRAVSTCLLPPLDLIRVSDTKYEGMATVRTSKSATEHQVKVDVTANGETTMWEAAPGSFMFVVQEAFDSSTPSS
jgi:hypothetical protein